VTISTSRLAKEAPKFSAELAISNVDVSEGYAILVQAADGADNETVLRVQKTSGTVRAFVPATDAGSYLVFVLVISTPTPRDADQIASLVTIRALE